MKQRLAVLEENEAALRSAGSTADMQMLSVLNQPITRKKACAPSCESESV